jgi:hypothetical protein
MSNERAHYTSIDSLAAGQLSDHALALATKTYRSRMALYSKIATSYSEDGDMATFDTFYQVAATYANSLFCLEDESERRQRARI